MKIEIEDKEMSKAIKQAIIESIERLDISNMLEDKLSEVMEEMFENNRDEIVKAMLIGVSDRTVS